LFYISRAVEISITMALVLLSALEPQSTTKQHITLRRTLMLKLHLASYAFPAAQVIFLLHC